MKLERMAELRQRAWAAWVAGDCGPTAILSEELDECLEEIERLSALVEVLQMNCPVCPNCGHVGDENPVLGKVLKCEGCGRSYLWDEGLCVVWLEHDNVGDGGGSST